MQVNTIQKYNISNQNNISFYGRRSYYTGQKEKTNSEDKQIKSYTEFYMEKYNPKRINSVLEKRAEFNAGFIRDKMGVFLGPKSEINENYKFHDEKLEKIRNYGQNKLLEKAALSYIKAQRNANKILMEFGGETTPTLKFAQILDSANVREGEFFKTPKTVKLGEDEYKVSFDGCAFNNCNYLKIEDIKNKISAYYAKTSSSNIQGEQNPFGYALRKISFGDYTVDMDWLNEGLVNKVGRKARVRGCLSEYKQTCSLLEKYRPTIVCKFPAYNPITIDPGVYEFQYNPSGRLEGISNENFKNGEGKNIKYYSGEDKYYLQRVHPIKNEKLWEYILLDEKPYQ